MIMFWNRKEVHAGISMKIFGKIIEVLSDNGIKFAYKVVNKSVSRKFENEIEQTESLTNNSEILYEYYVYVNKGDYDNAYALINKY